MGRKALPLLLMAAAELKREFSERRFELMILGGGKQSEPWQALARQLEIDDLITWTGQIPLQPALDEMRAKWTCSSSPACRKEHPQW